MDRRISQIGPDDMRAYCQGLQRMRRVHHTGCDKSFKGRQTDDESARVDATTVRLHAADAKSMFLWAQRHGYCKEPPLAGLVIDLPKKSKGKKGRIPFEASDAVTLFTSPTFTGCAGPRRRFNAGPFFIRDATFWIPILGFYTGARLSELVQLHLSDVFIDGPIPFIDINENNTPGAPGSQKHVKSQAGVRKVPIHADLVDLGFLEFVADRQGHKRAKATPRLFFEVPYGADGQPSTAFSKRFARMMDRAGLTDPALVFHSFRHTVEDALRNAKEPQYLINRLIGHDENHVSGEYGQGVSLEVAKAAIDGMKLPARLPSLLQPHVQQVSEINCTVGPPLAAE